MKKIFTLTIILALLGFTIGCFDVERNNPFDPDADLPDSEKMVTVKGFTYRGYTNQLLPNVKVTIGGNTVTSDSGGYYSIDIMPGTHNLKATKDGWSDLNYQINVQAKATATQYEDISMFIWWEYWEAYNPGEVPQNPWGHDAGTLGYNMINNNYVLELYVNSPTDPSDYATTWLPNWLNKTTLINNVLIGLRFSNTYYNETYQGFSFENSMAMPIIMVSFHWGELRVESEMGVIAYVANSDITERDIMVEIRINTINRTKGNVYFYDSNGNPIFQQAEVSFSENFNPDILMFDLRDWAAGTGVQGAMQVLFVEFF